MTSQPSITEALVAEILATRKFVSSVKTDNTHPSKAELRSRRYVAPNEKLIVWNLRFVNMREKDIPLQFTARQETAISGVGPKPTPGFSLKWKGVRIRGVNWNIRHDNVLNGHRVEPVRGWHEKVWNPIDDDKHIIDINDDVKNTDFRAMLGFCCGRWNIEFRSEQYQMGDL